MGTSIGVWRVACDTQKKISLRGAWSHQVTPLSHIPKFCRLLHNQLLIIPLTMINPFPNQWFNYRKSRLTAAGGPGLLPTGDQHGRSRMNCNASKISLHGALFLDFAKIGSPSLFP
ncbi:hypothetical protein XENTR_v10013565 [Xenopus tropicalis]|nr:hypothetical protein XENTR_v10013565 [Xenopus tropicalis]